jgi:hypothetical protein
VFKTPHGGRQLITGAGMGRRAPGQWFETKLSKVGLGDFEDTRNAEHPTSAHVIKRESTRLYQCQSECFYHLHIGRGLSESIDINPRHFPSFPLNGLLTGMQG